MLTLTIKAGTSGRGGARVLSAVVLGGVEEKNIAQEVSARAGSRCRRGFATLSHAIHWSETRRGKYLMWNVVKKISI